MPPGRATSPQRRRFAGRLPSGDEGGIPAPVTVVRILSEIEIRLG